MKNLNFWLRENCPKKCLLGIFPQINFFFSWRLLFFFLFFLILFRSILVHQLGRVGKVFPWCWKSTKGGVKCKPWLQSGCRIKQNLLCLELTETNKLLVSDWWQINNIMARWTRKWNQTPRRTVRTLDFQLERRGLWHCCMSWAEEHIYCHIQAEYPMSLASGPPYQHRQPLSLLGTWFPWRGPAK